MPLAVDGLVVAASMTMMARRRAGKDAGWLAWVSLAAAIAASLAANVAAAQPTLIGRAVAAWPPLALLLAYELLMDQIRLTATVATSPATPGTTWWWVNVSGDGQRYAGAVVPVARLGGAHAAGDDGDTGAARGPGPAVRGNAAGVVTGGALSSKLTRPW